MAKEAVKKYIEYLQGKDKYGVNPVTALDYSSLYPSLIMTYNLSPEYLITDFDYKEKLKEKYDIHDIEFVYNYEDFEGTLKSKIVKGWTVRHNNDHKFGLYPEILKDLFRQRSEMKKSLAIYKEKKEHMEKEFSENKEELNNNRDYQDCLFKLKYCDTKQKALKVYMNCFYGELGNKNSPLFILELAGGITSAGQMNLKKVKSHIEEKGCKTYYGDSVSADTPIIIKNHTGEINILTIEELHKYSKQVKSHSTLHSDEKDIIDSSNCSNEDTLYVKTENGWSKILKYISHKTNKKLYRITTHLGSVIVTEDHSLLDDNANIMKPTDCIIGSKLLHWDFQKSNIDNDLIRNVDLNKNFNISFVKGFFYGDGSCGIYKYKNQTKYSFALNNSNLMYLQKCVDIFNNYYSDVKLKIIDTLKNSKVYKAIAIGNVKKIVIEYKKEFYYGKYKKIPANILNENNNNITDFLIGYYLANGDKTFNRMTNKGQIGSQGLLYLLTKIGYNTSVNIRSDKKDIYRISFTSNNVRNKAPNAIKKIELIDNSNSCTVYDLETESHHFAAGVGQIVVHNTDSLYFTFSDDKFLPIHRQYLTSNHNTIISKEEYCSKLVEITFKLVKQLAVEVNNFLLNDNGTEFLKMAYEEVLYPVVFLARKKYYGIAHEGLVNFNPKELFIRGLEVKKRGVSEILRIVCLETMWESVNIFNKFTLRELVMRKVDYIFSRQWEIEEFIQTALWKPNKKNQTLITYVNRMIADGRDPPSPYERFNYVIVKIKDPLRLYDFKGRKLDIKKGDKMEYLEYVVDNNMEIDLEYYFSKQLIGQFARLISYDGEFHQFKQNFTIGEFLEEEEMEILDNKTMNNCKRYIKEYAKKYTAEEQYGNMYKKAYRTINSLVKTERQSMCKKNKNAIIMFNHKEELMDGKAVDVRVIIKEKIKSILNEDKIKKSIELESENSWKSMKNNNMDITKLFNRKKNSFLNNLLETHQKNFEKATMDIIKFTRDKKIDDIIFNAGEQNISPLMKKILTGNKDIFEDEDKLEDKIKTLYYNSIDKKENYGEKLEEDMEKAYKMFINIIAIKKSKKILKNIMEINITNIEKQVNKNQTKFIKGFRL